MPFFNFEGKKGLWEGGTNPKITYTKNLLDYLSRNFVQALVTKQDTGTKIGYMPFFTFEGEGGGLWEGTNPKISYIQEENY